jgi:bidirectional [NiFe] hydrogenase diaphorase subunit
MATIQINGISLEAAETMTVLEVARREGIEIPTLCHNEALGVYGACRLCIVEAEGPMLRKALVASCTLPVANGLVVETESPAVQQTRKILLELLIGRSESTQIREMAARFGVTASRFIASEPDDCVRCGLCVRVCRDKIGTSAISFVGRGQKRRVSAEFGQISQTCIGCGSCASLCPTGAIRLKDEDGIRTIFLKNNTIGRFTLVECSSCGTPYTTKNILEYVTARIEEQPPTKKSNLCPECARVHYAEALVGESASWIK